MQKVTQQAAVRQQSGQAMVEFALVIGILSALVFSIIALWPVINSHDAIAIAAASGAHEAAISGGNTSRVQRIVHDNLTASSINLNADAAVIHISCGGQSVCERYDPITVDVELAVEPWLDLPWLPDSFQVAASYTRAAEIDGGGSLSTGELEPGDPAQPVPVPGGKSPGIPGGK